MHITEEAKYILAKIAGIQIESYNRILESGVTPEDVHLFRLEPVDIEHRANRAIKEYQGIISNPNILGIFDDKEISTMRHILYRMEDDWVTTNPTGCRDLWESFYQIEECRNPLITFSLKNIQNDKRIRRK